MKLRLPNLCYLLPSVVLVFGFTTPIVQEPWVAPDKVAKMANPVKADAESLDTGKSLWVTHCQSCHGKKGKGDGNKAAQLKTPVGDFTTADFQKQSDGSIFYKTSEGRSDMPSFKKKIPDADELWSLVNYIRTLK
ncbi:c-type cytochrome [Chryseolinea soli]|uniref:Cytochrome c n=1 Tax=Chryseolinea soli TaxID=2321403 RepID=A0A385SVA3_9BACT|nr:cytochrome c [Chryseolinea soli]AYB35149.1 cytochrome c [Chryseolinea soli]